MSRGYFGVGVWHPKTEVNVGTLMRTARCFGAAFAFTVGRRYSRQASDTPDVARHVPLFNFSTVDDLANHLPSGCRLVGVELDERAKPLETFTHPVSACYLLGAEDHGLTEEMRQRCHELVYIPGSSHCLNVSVAGSIALYDRMAKRGRVDNRLVGASQRVA